MEGFWRVKVDLDEGRLDTFTAEVPRGSSARQEHALARRYNTDVTTPERLRTQQG